MSDTVDWVVGREVVECRGRRWRKAAEGKGVMGCGTGNWEMVPIYNVHVLCSRSTCKFIELLWLWDARR